MVSLQLTRDVATAAQNWLYPGLRVKRWLLLLLLCTCQNTTVLLREWSHTLCHWLTMPYPSRPNVFGPMPAGSTGEWISTTGNANLGGGTGLSALLKGLKTYTDHITAIVTVADDGGSSGKLRRELGVLPPGDFRNCIAALADDEALTTQLFQYRFPTPHRDADTEHTLDGHSFGNLFITAMANVTGSFEKALVESGRVLAIRGQILPSTLEDVTLCADLVDEAAAIRRVAGESAIPEARLPIERVYLEPANVPAYPPALRAILDADLVIIGPGSLFTSVLPNLLVDEITDAIRASNALKIYVCNVATQPGETDGFDLSDHVQALERHVGSDLFAFVLANESLDPLLPANPALTQVPQTNPPGARYQVVTADMVDKQRPWRHNPGKLAHFLIAIYEKQDEAQSRVRTRVDKEVRL
jgi:uncharacterized cofD-like protein